ncbi:MAG: flagellar basal-body rod protein FlgF [Rhodocyclaceae bacterium]|nr:MAG: flagellar basal-body rod protein FlgF [Rhodocyclaceae bacterium]
MDRVIYTAMTGASHALKQQAGMANNMANATTNGFRAEMHAFRAVPVEGEGLPTRAFVVDASVMTDFTPGTLQQTGRPLDIAVQGQGFIALSMPDGSEAYTRNGNLAVSANGLLQTNSGILIQGDNGPITIPPDTEAAVASDGTVSVVPRFGSPNAVSVVGRIKLTNPPEHAIERGDDGLFRLRAGMAADAGNANVTVASGFLEGSNVDMAAEMVSMISVARQFEMQLKVITTADENDRAATKLLSLT